MLNRNSEAYNKTLLTLVALCLMYLCLRDSQLLPVAAGADDGAPKRPAIQDTIFARKLVIVDAEGKARVALVHGGLAVFDRDEQISVFLGNSEKQDWLKESFFPTEHRGMLLFFDKNQKIRAKLALDIKDGSPSLKLFDAEQKQTWSTP